MNLLDDPILTVPQVAKYLQISRSKTYYLVQSKKLPHIKIERNVRILQSDLQKWLSHHTKGL
jgi:excisionase family DNA binding protein